MTSYSEQGKNADRPQKWRRSGIADISTQAGSSLFAASVSFCSASLSCRHELPVVTEGGCKHTQAHTDRHGDEDDDVSKAAEGKGEGGVVVYLANGRAAIGHRQRPMTFPDRDT